MEISHFLKTEFEIALAKNFIDVQNNGVIKMYYEAALKVCKEQNVPICDIYEKWEKMASNGVNVTDLLANKYNHPIREFHKYIAIELIETMFDL